MVKILAEYTVKQRTTRWPLAFCFFNIVDIASLASYIIYMEHNPHFKCADPEGSFQTALYAINRSPTHPNKYNLQAFYTKCNRVGTWTRSQSLITNTYVSEDNVPGAKTKK